MSVNPKFLAIGSLTGIVAVVALSTAFGSFYTVDQTERGVLLRNGAYVETVGPGLHFKLPWLESVSFVPVTTHTRAIEHMESYSSDQQRGFVKISYTYHIEPSRVEDVYSKFSNLENLEGRLLGPRVPQEFKVVFGRFSASQAINDRARLNSEAYRAIANALSGNPEVVLEGIQIEDIQFSDEYIKNVEDRMAAEISVQKFQQDAVREKVSAEITVTRAKAVADSTLAQAQADAQSTRIRGQAEADAIRAKGEALRDNPLITEQTKAERWNGVGPVSVTMIPGSTIPIMAVGTVK